MDPPLTEVLLGLLLCRSLTPVLLSPAQSPAAPVDPLQQAYAGMQHYTGEPFPPSLGP